jgi:hypothetical protein
VNSYQEACSSMRTASGRPRRPWLNRSGH